MEFQLRYFKILVCEPREESANPILHGSIELLQTECIPEMSLQCLEAKRLRQSSRGGPHCNSAAELETMAVRNFKL